MESLYLKKIKSLWLVTPFLHIQWLLSPEQIIHLLRNKLRGRMNYYQHHIGDFNNATRHLSLIERAIYRDLLDMYYDTEKAIDATSIDRLARRLQCTTEEQKEALKYVLDEFFILEEGVYRNNRCEREIAEYHGKKKQASEAGKASAAKRAAKRKVRPTVVHQKMINRLTKIQRSLKIR